MWAAAKHNGSWIITRNNQYERLGLIFHDHSTNEKLIKDAVWRLNSGENTVRGTRGWFKINIDSKGLANAQPIGAPKCTKCKQPVEMKPGVALVPAWVYCGDHQERIGPPKLTSVWKCPDCGYSIG